MNGGGDHSSSGVVMPAAATAPPASHCCADEGDGAGDPANSRRAGCEGTGTSRVPAAVPRPTDGPFADLVRRPAAAPASAVLPVPAARSAALADGSIKPGHAVGACVGDQEFRDYVRTRQRALLRTAYLLTGNMADAEDLVQSALAKTYLAWDRIADHGALDGYVRRAIVNTHISWWRRRRVEEFPTDELPDRAVADNAVSSELQEALRRAVDRLPQRMRAAILLRYYDDMTEAEVAEVLGVSLGTVKSTVARAVAKLRVDAELQPD